MSIAKRSRRTRRSAFVWSVLAGPLLLGCVLLLGIQAGCEAAPSVVIEGPQGTRARFTVEVAHTVRKRQRGLKHRRDLREDQGMLFVFPDEQEQWFWMKDTPLSLDIIFMNRGREVVGILHDTVPFSTRPLTVGVPSRYVLEVRGGVARRKGIAVGDSARFSGIR